MTEKYRLQAKMAGKWQTQQLFSSPEDYPDARSAFDQLVATGRFEDVRILEIFINAPNGKTVYKSNHPLSSGTDPTERTRDEVHRRTRSAKFWQNLHSCPTCEKVRNRVFALFRHQ